MTENNTPAFQFSDQRVKGRTASDVIVENLKEYSADIVLTKYPNPIDGLKQIHRRILYCIGASTEKDAVTALIGDASKLHQGGDASIYDALIRMAQRFSIGEPLVHIPGNYGEYFNPNSAGAPRYLEIQSSEFARDIFFNGVYKDSIPMTESKDFRRKEPMYYIPRIPTALLLNNLSVGYGFKAELPQLNLANLCDIVMRFAELRGTGIKQYPAYKDVAELMLPDFPINGYIRNKKSLLESYSRGEFEVPIALDGILELVPNGIHIHNLPFGVKPVRIFRDLITKLTKDKSFWMSSILKDINNYSGDNDSQCDLNFTFKNSVSVFSILNEFKKIVNLSDTYNPTYYFVQNKRLCHFDPFSLMDLWYQERMKSIVSGIKGRQNELIMKLQRLSAYQVFAEHADPIIKIIKSSENEDIAVRALADKFKNLTRMQARILANTKISALTRHSKEDILRQITQTNQDLVETRDNYGKVHETIFNDANFIKKKYGRARTTRFVEDFIGYVHIDQAGIIQFVDERDMFDIVQRFSNAKSIRIHLYRRDCPSAIPVLNGRVLYEGTTLPREFQCTRMIDVPVGATCTLVIGSGSACVVDGISLARQDDLLVLPMTKSFYGITRKGDITLEDTQSLVQRKRVTQGAKSELIYAIPYGKREVIVAHMNNKEPNVVRMDLVLPSPSTQEYGRLKTVVTGNTEILAVFSKKTAVQYLSLPSRCMERNATRFMRLCNISALFDKTNHIQIDVGKTKSSAYAEYFKKHKELPNTLQLTVPKTTR